jgi:glutathione synthase/RimK-type ligase-like ATP-grasp enzyme
MRPQAHLRSAHARYAAAAAQGCGYGFRTLDGDDGYLFEISDGARRAVFAAGAGAPYALNDARGASLARDKAFCARTLHERGVPTLPGRMFFVTPRWADMRAPGREPQDALAYAAQADYPLFCKPISGSNGVYAEVIADCDAFADYMARVAREHFAILIQPFVRGDEYRVFVLDGRALFTYRKHLPSVRGDGRSSVRALVEALARDNGGPSTRARDGAGRAVAPNDVPAEGERLWLEGPANRAAGGGASGLVDGAPPALARIAIEACDILGLRLAGVDIFDLSPKRDITTLSVIEVNSNPMIETLEENDRWDLISEIWRANFEAALR